MMRARSVDMAPNVDHYHINAAGLLIPGPAPEPIYTPIALDLFCGAGGFSCGVTQAGFHVAAACEWDYWCMQTYITNLGGPDTRIVVLGDETRATIEKETARKIPPEKRTLEHGNVLERQPDGTYRMPDGGSAWLAYGTERQHYAPCEVFYFGDVRLLKGQQIIDDLRLDTGELALLFGGPPCQGFSIAGKRNVMDPRNSLIFEYARLVVETRPQTFCLENVVGIASMVTPEGMPVIDAFCLAVSKSGYGTYEALKKMMGSVPNGRVGTRVHANHTAPDLHSETDSASVQGNLFDMVGA